MAITIQLPSGERIAVVKDTAIIGKDERCDVRLPDYAGLEPRHARIRKVADRWLIESLGDWKVEVRGSEPSRMAWLKPGDMIFLTPGVAGICFEPQMALEPAREPLAERKRRSVPPPLPNSRKHAHPSSTDNPRNSELSGSDGQKQSRSTPPPLTTERDRSAKSVGSGPPPLPSNKTGVQGIGDKLSNLIETKGAGHLAADEEIRQHSASIELRWLTPRRIYYGVYLAGALMVLLAGFGGLKSINQAVQGQIPSNVSPPVTTSDKKLKAFQELVQVYKQAPDEFASTKERQLFNQRLEGVQAKFDEIPFDPTMDREQAKQIIQLFQKEIEHKYSGLTYMGIEESIANMYISMIK